MAVETVSVKFFIAVIMCDRSNQVRKVLLAAVQRVPVHHAGEGMAVGLALSVWQLPARRQRELFRGAARL